MAAEQQLRCHQDWPAKLCTHRRSNSVCMQQQPDVLAAAVVGLQHARLGNQVPFASCVDATCLLQRIVRCNKYVGPLALCDFCAHTRSKCWCQFTGKVLDLQRSGRASFHWAGSEFEVNIPGLISSHLIAARQRRRPSTTLTRLQGLMSRRCCQRR